MIKTYVIATSKACPKDHLDEFVNRIKAAAEQSKCKVLAMFAAPGPGCNNLALKVEGETAEQFVQGLTGALMPARYAETKEQIEGFDISAFGI